ncbi:hypothetical protein VFPPC_15730 [Pochonia chlamydosporia 170]|uniref:Uncharacterized protein n=1 Tax=Pochonia chlamydosporia 170 TaxID=1380566 RepID=A0A179FRG3_METCM|nr:hypothetical protein VFPPC_15730 [Pochonia chlamydosporia 170]OAQ67790.1 hypothetical protein VFPPC_15730 [Pochonia chlamydosporia 170]
MNCRQHYRCNETCSIFKFARCHGREHVGWLVKLGRLLKHESGVCCRSGLARSGTSSAAFGREEFLGIGFIRWGMMLAARILIRAFHLIDMLASY